MLREDCKFINDNKSDCKALKRLYCKTEKKDCKFYQQRSNTCIATRSEKRW